VKIVTNKHLALIIVNVIYSSTARFLLYVDWYIIAVKLGGLLNLSFNICGPSLKTNYI
jgi:hypothetical protein